MFRFTAQRLHSRAARLGGCLVLGSTAALLLLAVAVPVLRAPGLASDATEVKAATLGAYAATIVDRTSSRFAPVSPFENVPIQRPDALDGPSTNARYQGEVNPPSPALWTPDTVPPLAIFASVPLQRPRWNPNDVGPPMKHASSRRASHWSPDAVLPPI